MGWSNTRPLGTRRGIGHRQMESRFWAGDESIAMWRKQSTQQPKTHPPRLRQNFNQEKAPHSLEKVDGLPHTQNLGRDRHCLTAILDNRPPSRTRRFVRMAELQAIHTSLLPVKTHNSNQFFRNPHRRFRMLFFEISSSTDALLCN